MSKLHPLKRYKHLNKQQLEKWPKSNDRAFLQRDCSVPVVKSCA